MIENVVVAPYGRPAGTALGHAISAEKGEQSLAPVTVIVPSNFAGLTARRLLGTGALGPKGVANVGFVTPFRLAELLAAGHLADRHPLTNPVLGAAVRGALADDPGPFEAVADHHATESALASLAGELGNVSKRSLARLQAAGGSAAVAVQFHRSIQDRLGDFHDEADVARAASGRADLASALDPFGRLIWFLPAPTTRPLRDFLRSVFAVAPTTAIVGLTGADDADDGVRQVCSGVGIEAALLEAPLVPAADRIVSVTDADEEVRSVLRMIVAQVEQGVPLDRIGIFHPSPDPYVRILEQQLAAAEIPANGPSRLRLADSVAGRTLLAALELPAVRWRRDRVLGLVSGGPLRFDGASVRPASWETLSREAGVVQGLGDWKSKLALRKHTLEARRAEGEARRAEGESPGSGSGSPHRLERELDDVAHLAAFIEHLDDLVSEVDRAVGWQAKTTAAKTLLVDLLGPSHFHSSWPESEQDAFDRVEEALSRLGALEEIEPTPRHAVFVRALTSELDVARGRSGRFGHGLVYGPLASAVGLDLDSVFVLGCAEGLLPRARRDDALLPDAARALTDGELDLRSERLGEQRRQFLAALSAAPVGRRCLLFPRGDLRGGRRALPSRWLLDSASEVVGRTVHATDFEGLDHEAIEHVASHSAGILHARLHASVGDRDLAAVAQYIDDGGAAADHPAAAGVARGLQAQAARRGAELTEWDGNLAGQPIESTAERPLSPTRLQTWAACGYRYFLSYVLGLADREDPERLLDISPLDRGSGVHAVLERFIQEIIEADTVPEPDQPWSDAQRARVAELAEEVFDSYEKRGRTGRPVRWQITKSDLLALLDDFLTADDAYRAKTRSRPTKVELPFGLHDASPVSLDLPDGRSLQFRGMIDRLDRSDDGRTFVSDYKTGSDSPYKGIDKGDPVQGGQKLQLGLYAEAARQHAGAGEVEAHYWVVSAKAAHQRFGYPWTADRRERMLDVLTVIADGVEGGNFPASPGEWNSWRQTHDACAYCEFDRVCDRDRGEQALAKIDAPELRLRSALAWDPEDELT